jgi:hypothetical protein
MARQPVRLAREHLPVRRDAGEEMIAARNERRRRLRKPSIGDELAGESGASLARTAEAGSAGGPG